MINSKIKSYTELCDELNDDRRHLKSAQLFYESVKFLTKFGNFISSHGMVEIFEEERGGEYQWERFHECNRDVLRWINGMDEKNRQKFLVNLLFSECIAAQHIRNA
jgi:hypothetical protein